MVEFVVQNFSDSFSQGMVLILFPDRQIFTNAVNLNRFKHHADPERSKETADPCDDSKFHPPSEVQPVQRKVKKLFPEGCVFRLNGDEWRKDLGKMPFRHFPEFN